MAQYNKKRIVNIKNLLKNWYNKLYADESVNRRNIKCIREIFLKEIKNAIKG